MRFNLSSRGRVLLSLFTMSALVSVAFIAGIVLFATAHLAASMIPLSVSVVGFIALFGALNFLVKREAVAV